MLCAAQAPAPLKTPSLKTRACVDGWQGFQRASGGYPSRRGAGWASAPDGREALPDPRGDSPNTAEGIQRVTEVLDADWACGAPSRSKTIFATRRPDVLRLAVNERATSFPMGIVYKNQCPSRPKPWTSAVMR